MILNNYCDKKRSLMYLSRFTIFFIFLVLILSGCSKSTTFRTKLDSNINIKPNTKILYKSAYVGKVKETLIIIGKDKQIITFVLFDPFDNTFGKVGSLITFHLDENDSVTSISIEVSKDDPSFLLSENSIIESRIEKEE